MGSLGAHALPPESVDAFVSLATDPKRPPVVGVVLCVLLSMVSVAWGARTLWVFILSPMLASPGRRSDVRERLTSDAAATPELQISDARVTVVHDPRARPSWDSSRIPEPDTEGSSHAVPV